jgi:hypothetical protein
MAELINAKCPNCGAVLELPADIDRAFCIHCGGKVIIAKDEVHYHTQKTAIACPECHGKGYFTCRTCNGSGRCTGRYTKQVDGRPHTTWCQNGWCPKCRGKGNELFILKCSLCKGSKVCPTCRGNGKCNTCRGTGKITCWACKGSGFKVYRGD